MGPFQLHCESDRIIQGGIYDHAMEKFSIQQLRRTISKLKIESKNLKEEIKLDQVVFEKLKTNGYKSIQEAVISGSFGNISSSINSFDSFEEHLMYWGRRQRVTFLLAKCLECVVEYRATLFLLFRDKLMENWIEMLDLSPNDHVRIKTGEQMKEYYKMLSVNMMVEFWNRKRINEFN